MHAVLGDFQRSWLRQVEHLAALRFPLAVGDAQRRTAPATLAGHVVADHVRVGPLAQRCAFVPGLTAGAKDHSRNTARMATMPRPTGHTPATIPARHWVRNIPDPACHQLGNLDEHLISQTTWAVTVTGGMHCLIWQGIRAGRGIPRRRTPNFYRTRYRAWSRNPSPWRRGIRFKADSDSNRSSHCSRWQDSFVENDSFRVGRTVESASTHL